MSKRVLVWIDTADTYGGGRVHEGEYWPVEPDYEAMAKRIIDWTYEPEGETRIGEMVAEMWRVGIGGDDAR